MESSRKDGVTQRWLHSKFEEAASLLFKLFTGLTAGTLFQDLLEERDPYRTHSPSKEKHMLSFLSFLHCVGDSGAKFIAVVKTRKLGEGGNLISKSLRGLSINPAQFLM